jgi:winged helix DNA-binding protein
MADPKPALHLSLERARAAGIAAQGLHETAGASIASALEQRGFVRTLGGTDAYLALLARVPGLKRADVDAAIGSGEAKVVPSVRGCMYLIARSQVPLALRAADWLSRATREREQAKAGIEPSELEQIGKAVLEALAARGPLTTDALRRALPEGTVRSLGAAGKKLGISSPLPSALRRLEMDGAIERVPAEMRLDNERYHWRIPPQDPFAAGPVPQEPPEAYARLAELFFRQAGVSTQADFASWMGLSQRDARAAIERTALLPVTVEGLAGIAYAPEALRPALETAPPAGEAAALLAFEDNLLALHGGPGLFVDASHQGIELPQWGSSKTETLAKGRHVAMRCALAGHKIAGLWEYDPDTREAVVACFDKPSAAVRRRLDAAAAETGRFLTEELGHGRSFSLDTDVELRQRVAFVRELG